MSFDVSAIKLTKKDRDKGLFFPTRLSDELAELIGVHIGDGTMSCSKEAGAHVAYYGNLQKDLEYFGHLRGLIKGLFGIEANVKILESKSTVFILIYSKALCAFMNQCIGLPYGEKSKTIDVPLLVINSKKFCPCFISGLFDTDGCVFVQEGRYPTLKISTASKRLAGTLKEMLEELGFTPFISKKNRNPDNPGYDVVVKGSENFDRWIKIIGSSNPRNLKNIEKIKSGVTGIRIPDSTAVS